LSLLPDKVNRLANLGFAANDEAQMPNDESSPNSRMSKRRMPLLVVGISSFLRH
jgi:hypothetical protein